MKLIPALLLIIVFPLSAQTPKVPHKMRFADMTLTIRDDARDEIQKDVNALTQSPKHFNIKVERARTYFPLIEQIFAEENVPDDFKYLVLQESALIPDAVSVSDAVGFWQFKDFTAVEMGLRVDKNIDERMNIISSSRAAAGYLKKNNKYFDNWIYALQAYQMGAGGVMRSVKNTQGGVKHMEITSKTYWYVKKYLAHKVAFEDAVKGPGQIQVVTYENNTKRSLKDLAKELEADEEDLRNYNKWIRGDNIPDDRIYAVAIPVKGGHEPSNLPKIASLQNKSHIQGRTISNAARIRINTVPAVKAEPGETAAQFAERSNISLSKFLKYNDMPANSSLIPGEYYFVANKKSRSEKAYHKVTEGEQLWDVSQRYGVKLTRLQRYNRMDENERLKPGTTLWLSSKKPKNAKPDKVITEVVEVSEQETFNWAVEPEVKSVTVVSTTKEIAVIPPSTAPEVPAKDSAVAMPEVVTKETNMVFQVDSTNQQTFGEEVVESPAATSRKDSVSIASMHEVKPQSHAVQPGETLYAIAKRYNVSVMELVEWNSLSLQESIKVGQVLQLTPSSENTMSGSGPEPSPVLATTETIHEVKPSDTLYSVARKYGVTIKELMDWNNKKDFNLSVGEKLRIVTK